jgi:hypothetical protein
MISWPAQPPPQLSRNGMAAYRPALECHEHARHAARSDGVHCCNSSYGTLWVGGRWLCTWAKQRPQCGSSQWWAVCCTPGGTSTVQVPSRMDNGCCKTATTPSSMQSTTDKHSTCAVLPTNWICLRVRLQPRTAGRLPTVQAYAASTFYSCNCVWVTGAWLAGGAGGEGGASPANARLRTSETESALRLTLPPAAPCDTHSGAVLEPSLALLLPLWLSESAGTV